MAQIIYQILTGVPNFTASISPAVSPTQILTELGVYSFDDIPEDIYTLTVVDTNGCQSVLEVNLFTGVTTSTTSTTTSSSTSSTTTSTTTLLVTTTTTSTTELPFLRTFYFSNSGSDSNTGTSISSPFATIAKANTLSLVAGDGLLFKRGDTFSGTLTLSASGSALQPITIGSYGSGNEPLFTAFSTISGWISEGSGIYSKVITGQSTPNIVTVNSVNTPMGRYPNTGYLSIDSHVSNTSITDAALNSSVQNWSGAEVVIRKNRWVIDRCNITTHINQTLNYTGGSSYPAINGYGYFIQNDLKCLTEVGDWAYKTNKLYMYFGANDPSTYIVKMSVLDKLITLSSNRYINISNLKLEGANIAEIYSNASTNLNIDTCIINYGGIDGVKALNSSYLHVTNSVFNYINRDAFNANTASTNVYFAHNTVNEIGIIAGMSGNGDGQNLAVCANGMNNIIEYNTIENVGYIGISFSGANSYVRNNYINNYCLIRDDGGGIYTYQSAYTGRPMSYVSNNIILNGIGNTEGVPSSSYLTMGIYLDNYSENITINQNVTAYSRGAGIYLGEQGKNNIVSNNTMYNNKYDLWSNRGAGAVNPAYNILNNIFYSSSVSYIPVNLENSSPLNFGTLNNNYYYNSINEPQTFRLSEGGYHYESLVQWKSNWGKDANSVSAPFVISSQIFDYTLVSKTVTGLVGYKNINNVPTTGYTLNPYESIILIK